MARNLYLGIDLGTTGIKVGLFDESGQMAAAATREIHLDTPAPGFAEFDADAYVGLAFDAVREALATPGIDATSVRAVGFSSQAQTFVVLGKDGRPLRSAVSWLDVRAHEEAAELSSVSEGLGRGTISAISSGPKILWLQRHERDIMAHAARVLVIPDYLIWQLTGRAVSDPILAASTALYDPWKRLWHPELLRACGIEEAMMPEVLLPGDVAGTLTTHAAQELGLRKSVVVAVGTNDQYAGALGAGNVTPGCVSLALGTALAAVATSRTRENVPRAVGVCPHPAGGGLFALLAFAKTSGVLLRWFRDQFAPSLSYDELFAEIGAVPIGAEGVTCIPHFSGTATPDFNSAVRGAFVGLNLSHGRAHMARALAESLAFTVRDNLELLNQTVGVSDLRAIGGGAKSDVWLQMIADVTGASVTRPKTREAACLGAAALGMVAAGRFGSVAEAATGLFQPERRFEPNWTTRTAYDAAHAVYRRVLQRLYP